MTKHFLFSLAIIVFLITGCFNQADNDNGTDSEAPAEEVTLATLLSETGNFVDKPVKVSGTVDHVCKHGGKKMFIFGKNPDDRIKITTGEKMSSFDPALEGSDVFVSGIVREMRVDEDYLMNWEMELTANKNEKKKHMEVGSGEGKHEPGESEENSAADEMNQISSMRKQLEDSGKDHLSFYSIECIEFNEK
jgi:hypothetical protein